MALSEIFCSLFWILTIIDRIDLADGNAVAHPRIFPSPAVIKRGSTLEVFCSLGKNLYEFKNASDITWTVDDNKIEKENYIIVNESVSGLITRNFTHGKATVKCFVDLPSSEQQVALTEVKTGFPPQAPENISCCFHYLKSFTCNWTAMRETYIETHYTLFITYNTEVNEIKQFKNDILCVENSVCDKFQPSYLNAQLEKEIRLGFNSTQADKTDMPENVTCIYSYGNAKIEWTARNVYLSSGCRQIVKKDQNFKAALKYYNCSSKKNSCSVSQVEDVLNSPYCVQVKAHNSLGEVKSDCVLQNHDEIIKFDPPQNIKLERVLGIKQMLKVTWERPTSYSAPLDCQIQYTASTKNHSGKVNVYMGEVTKKSFNLTNLWDSMNYTVGIRCKHNKSRFWSEWSKNKTEKTEEQANWGGELTLAGNLICGVCKVCCPPAHHFQAKYHFLDMAVCAPMKVNLWRVIESHEPTGNRIVHLMWKKCEEFPSSGIIVDYQIKYSTENNKSSCHKTTSNETVTFNVTDEAYQFSVVARNTVGESPEAILRIPSIHEERKDQRIVLLSASPSHDNDKMVVEWETTDSNVTDYVIEWYKELETDIYKRSWQYVRNVTKWTSPKGAFEDFKCYNISVYPLYRGEIETPSSVRVYLRENSPSKGPNATVENFGKHEVTITWNEVAKADANGDIVNYTVFYGPDGGKELEETVNASVLRHQLTSLQAKTMYTVHVMASTRAGGTTGAKTRFITRALSTVESILINIVVGIFTLSLLTVGSLWALKKYNLKNICWPKIPYPTVSSFSDASQKILRESPSEQDTESSDLISILQVEASGENHGGDDEVQLENDFSQTDVTTKDVAGRNQILCSVELEPKKLLPQTIPSVGQELQSHTFSDLETFEDDENEQIQCQTNWKETTEVNPYLKNSVHRREFLFCENSNQNTEESKNPTNLMAASMPNDTGQPYVALNTFELFLKDK